MTEPFIMLVDDEVSFVEILAERLDERSIKAITAFGGEESLETLKTNQNLDVVVLDLDMPGMSGIETLRNIKKVSPLTEVIMLTGHATVESAIDGMKLGAYDFLIKPFDIEELVGIMENAAKKKRQHQEKIKDSFKKETLAKYGPFYYA